MKADPSQRQDMIDLLEAMKKGPPKQPSAPARPTCARCSSAIYGSYRQFKKPDGGTADLCEACAKPVMSRLRVLSAKPKFKERSLVRSALKDLKKAAKLDPDSDQIRNNIQKIRPLLSATKGSYFTYARLWVLSCMPVRLWDGVCFRR